MRLFRNSKKADLNLSVQAIVILIFAVIMLGLGLGLINFIFGSAREKVGQSLAVTELSVQPTSDKPVTIESEVSIKFKGEKKVQIGFYNSQSSSLSKVQPKITQCQTSAGDNIDPTNSLPTVAALPKEMLEAGNSEAWAAIVRLPDFLPSGTATGGTYSGALIPGTYICGLGIYACVPQAGVACTIDYATAIPIKTADFTLKVTS